MSAPTAQAPPPYSETSATHIRELATINQDIPELLRKCAAVISLLTNKPIEQSAPIDKPAMRVDVIKDTSFKLFILINQIRTRLHNQINELRSQKVIPAEPTRYIPPPTIRAGFGGAFSEEERRQMESRGPEAGITNGGLGDLDIADLNARAGVREQGKEEVLARAQGILDELIKRMKERVGDS